MLTQLHLLSGQRTRLKAIMVGFITKVQWGRATVKELLAEGKRKTGWNAAR